MHRDHHLLDGLLANEWARVTEETTRRNFSGMTTEIMRLSFFLGVRCAVKAIMRSQSRDMVLLMMSSELRAFDREVSTDADAEEGTPRIEFPRPDEAPAA